MYREAFVEGAREGLNVAEGLLPYLVAMLCAVGVPAHLRSPGVRAGGNPLVRGSRLAWTHRFVDALPTRAGQAAFQACAARAMLIETMQTQGVGQLCGAGSRHHPGQHRDHVLRCWRCT